MRLSLSITRVAFVWATLLTGAPPAHAALTTWVSGVGDDANTCSRSAPCRTFFAAAALLDPGGTLRVASPGQFGPLLITHSMTVDGGDQQADILATGTNAVVVNAAVADVIELRNLRLHGGGSGLSAIKVLCAGSVHLQHVTVEDFGVAGVDLPLASPVTLTVEDSVFSGCRTGLWVNAAPATPRHMITVRNTAFRGPGGGIIADAGRLTVVGCTITGADTGVAAFGNAVVDVMGSVVANGTTGLSANTGTIRFYDSVILNNTTGLSKGPNGVLGSDSTSVLWLNAVDGAPAAPMMPR